MRRALIRAAIVAGVVGVLGGCNRAYFTSDVNAPGDVTLAPPAREDGSAALYVEPTDPGEHVLYTAPGVVIGPAFGRHDSASGPGLELGMYLRMAYNTFEHSHRKDDVPFPLAGWTWQVGWSPLQTSDDVDVGPVYAEVERNFFILSAGLGAAVYPDDGNAGVQATLSARPYGLRFRYMNETGFEFAVAIQLELPRAFSWSR